ncbi:MAG TPA: amidohydrolase family protein [Candidatus Brocadiia bacterium]|nr:amidohydrolase family protein [Candidatus Brocadiia bacterium]
MSFLDINAAIGRTTSGPPGFETPDALLTEMRRLGIGEALVCHRMAQEADVVLGNRLLLEALKGHPELLPCWVMAPPALGDLPPPGEWVGEAAANGVRAIRLQPRHSLYSLSEWCVGPLAEAVAGAGLPMLLDFGPRHWSEQVVPWSELEELCLGHPDLAVILIGCTVGETRNALGLMRRARNLHIEYHALSLPDGLTLMAGEGMAKRLLFGTGLPARAAECVIEQTRRSGLSVPDLLAASGLNARRVLRLTPMRVTEPRHPPGDACPIIDVHGHSGSWERACSPVNTPGAVVASMRRCGVAKMVLSSFAAIHAEMLAGNDQTAEAVAKFPGTLYGYAVANPHCAAEIPAELEKRFDKDKGFVGLKLHCGLHGVKLQHPGYEYALAFASERGLPALVHGGGGDKWGGVAARYPGATFIMAHGCAWDGRDTAGRELYAQVRDVPNLYVDVAGSAAYRRAMEALAELAGAEKILYGSDFPMFDLGFEIGRIVGSGMNEVAQAMILGGNAIRLFKRF